MTLNEFFTAYNGKKVDMDGVGSATNKYQCVDLIKAYCSRVFGIPAKDMNGYGDAFAYYSSYEKRPVLKKLFNRIPYESGMIFLAGDVVVWKASFNRIKAGHIAIATGKYSKSTFESFDQNYPSGSGCKFVSHGYVEISGILRPKNRTLLYPQSGYNEYPKPVKWKNGSTKELVFKTNSMEDKIGSLSPGESALCYSKAGSCYVLVYDLDGTDKHKAGFAEYSGGVEKAPPESKAYTNGSTPEPVYADTAKRLRVGSLDASEKCYCLGKIDNMYLVLYKVNGTAVQKCGFVSYNGVD